MRPTLRRTGSASAGALLGWAAFTLVYAAIGYFFTDHGRSFSSLLPGAAIAGVLFLVFYFFISGFTSRRRRSTADRTTGQGTGARHD